MTGTSCPATPEVPVLQLHVILLMIPYDRYRVNDMYTDTAHIIVGTTLHVYSTDELVLCVMRLVQAVAEMLSTFDNMCGHSGGGV